MHHIPPVDIATEEDCDYTGELVGAVVATFFITILVYTVVQVTVIAVVLKLKRKRYFQTLACHSSLSQSSYLSPWFVFIQRVRCERTEPTDTVSQPVLVDHP